MPSAFSHAIAGLGVGACFCGPEAPASAWALGALCGVLPDIDVAGFRFGVRYGSVWGHRGFTHSLVFAAALAGAIVGLGFRQGLPGLPPGWMWLYLFLATISHSLLDALTDGGLGVALFSPFDNRRFFFPVRPIEVASFGVRWLFTRRGAVVLASELKWVWLPSGILAGIAQAIRTGPENAPVNALGIRRIMFTVDDIDDVVARLLAHGVELVGEVVQYGDTYWLAYVRGPEGIIVALAEQLG